jgi:hypothetical protein
MPRAAEPKLAVAGVLGMDMIADVSMRMPADIRHNIAPECQAVSGVQAGWVFQLEIKTSC